MKKFRTALIIDDDQDLNMLLKAILEESITSVVCAATLQSVKELAAQLSPDIIFLDNNLPDGLGWEQTEYIVQHFPKTRINLISAYQYDHSITDRLSSVRIWEKPISLTDLNKYLN